MKENISPEEKLLRLIRGDKKPSPADAAPKDSAVAVKTADALGLKPSPLRLRVNYALINKYIPVIFMVSLLYLAAAFIYPFVGLKNIRVPDVSEEKSVEPRTAHEQTSRPYEAYLEASQGRQLFGSGPAQEIGAPTIKGEAESIKDISLVGIISGENPQAIISDNKTQQTYYLSKGQFVGEFQVEEIQEGKIILNSKGQRYELNI